LLAVFSIAFTVMTVSVVAQMTNWKETALRYEQHARVADTNLRNLIAASAADLATARDNVRAQLQKSADLEVQLSSRAADLNQARAELAKVTAEKTSAEAMSASLVNQLGAAEGARAEYRKQRDDLEKRNIELERRNVDLSDRVNELTARLAVLLEEKRQFEQQLNILKSENESLSRSARAPAAGSRLESPSAMALGGVEALTPVPAAAVRGHVQEVQDGLVTISVGSADGVKKDMVFVIHRDGNYVGDVRIHAVDPNQSAGRLVRSSEMPRVGDLATDAVSLAQSQR
jgi:hypothetical protein